MYLHVCYVASVVPNCVTLWTVAPPPSSSVPGISQARILEWIAILFSRGSPNPGIKPRTLVSPALAGRFFTTSATWEVRLSHQDLIILQSEEEPMLEKGKHGSCFYLGYHLRVLLRNWLWDCRYIFFVRTYLRIRISINLEGSQCYRAGSVLSGTPS